MKDKAEEEVNKVYVILISDISVISRDIIKSRYSKVTERADIRDMI